MRVTTDIWVSALVRRVFADGGFAAVAKRGATEAGAVFLITRSRFGEVSLFGPAMQTVYETARPDERRFMELLSTTDPAAVDARLEKERRFDPDIWIVELETAVKGIAELVSLAGVRQ
jgi:hypothetical protein